MQPSASLEASQLYLYFGAKINLDALSVAFCTAPLAVPAAPTARAVRGEARLPRYRASTLLQTWPALIQMVAVLRTFANSTMAALVVLAILTNIAAPAQDVARRCDARRRSSDGSRKPRSPEALACAVAATAKWTAKTISNIHASHA